MTFSYRRQTLDRGHPGFAGGRTEADLVSLVERRLGSVSSLGRLGRRGSSRRSIPLSWNSIFNPDLAVSTLMSDQVPASR
jgi:hypothetical protein